MAGLATALLFGGVAAVSDDGSAGAVSPPFASASSATTAIPDLGTVTLNSFTLTSSTVPISWSLVAETEVSVTTSPAVFGTFTCRITVGGVPVDASSENLFSASITKGILSNIATVDVPAGGSAVVAQTCTSTGATHGPGTATNSRLLAFKTSGGKASGQAITRTTADVTLNQYGTTVAGLSLAKGKYLVGFRIDAQRTSGTGRGFADCSVDYGLAREGISSVVPGVADRTSMASFTPVVLNIATTVSVSCFNFSAPAVTTVVPAGAVLWARKVTSIGGAYNCDASAYSATTLAFAVPQCRIEGNGSVSPLGKGSWVALGSAYLGSGASSSAPWSGRCTLSDSYDHIDPDNGGADSQLSTARDDFVAGDAMSLTATVFAGFTMSESFNEVRLDCSNSGGTTSASGGPYVIGSLIALKL